MSILQPGGAMPELTPAELAAAVGEINDEMDEIFGSGTPKAQLSRPAERRGEVAGRGGLESAMKMNESLIRQQQELSEPPIEHTRAVDDNQAPYDAPSEPSGGAGAVMQVFHGPVTLHQHFHVTVRRA